MNKNNVDDGYDEEIETKSTNLKKTHLKTVKTSVILDDNRLKLQFIKNTHINSNKVRIKFWE